mmetsp:Transcript_46675/g.146331  ORF Transcript_46675/g.146331 Transcript_46675/m.146331 type:complete len:420 (-) Transcript_46675:1066-2325(-)
MDEKLKKLLESRKKHQEEAEELEWAPRSTSAEEKPKRSSTAFRKNEEQDFTLSSTASDKEDCSTPQNKKFAEDRAPTNAKRKLPDLSSNESPSLSSTEIADITAGEARHVSMAASSEQLPPATAAQSSDPDMDGHAMKQHTAHQDFRTDAGAHLGEARPISSVQDVDFEIYPVESQAEETKPSETPQATLDESRLENFEVKPDTHQPTLPWPEEQHHRGISSHEMSTHVEMRSDVNPSDDTAAVLHVQEGSAASGHGAQTLDDMFQEFFHPAEPGETKADSREDLSSQTTPIRTSKPKSPSKTRNSEGSHKSSPSKQSNPLSTAMPKQRVKVISEYTKSDGVGAGALFHDDQPAAEHQGTSTSVPASMRTKLLENNVLAISTGSIAERASAARRICAFALPSLCCLTQACRGRSTSENI